MHGVQTHRAVRARRAPQLAVVRAGIADLARQHPRRMRIPALAVAERLRDTPRRRQRVRLARLARRRRRRRRRTGKCVDRAGRATARTGFDRVLAGRAISTQNAG